MFAQTLHTDDDIKPFNCPTTDCFSIPPTS
jgi:hypothetical protein